MRSSRHADRPRRLAARGRAHRLLLAAALIAGLAGCDALGNPEPMLATPPARWMGPGVALLTRTHSVPASRSDELSRRVPSGRFEHVDTVARPGDVVVLVQVEVAWARRPTGGAIPLVTVFQLADGHEIRRAWAGRAGASTWYGGFALPAAPAGAVTVLGP